MGISQLQRDAFKLSAVFNDQVNGILATETQYMYDTTADLTEMEKNILSQVAKMPNGYGFAAAIIADNAWQLMYDEWASDPEAQAGVISAAIHKKYKMLTGFEPHPPPP